MAENTKTANVPLSSSIKRQPSPWLVLTKTLFLALLRNTGSIFLPILGSTYLILMPILRNISRSEWIGIILLLIVLSALLETLVVGVLRLVGRFVVRIIGVVGGVIRFLLISCLIGLAGVDGWVWVRKEAKMEENRKLELKLEVKEEETDWDLD